MKKALCFSISAFFLTVLMGGLPTFAQHEGKIVFSTTPINLKEPTNLKNTFVAGDCIYSVAYLKDDFRTLSGSENPKKVELEILFYEIKPPLYSYQKPSEKYIDNTKIWLSSKAIENKYLVLDIVPEPDKMTAYKDPNVVFEKFGKHIDGPIQFAEVLGKLESGKHTILFKLKCHYDVVAAGDFVIEGDNFPKYLALAKEIKTLSADIDTERAKMPKPKMTDKKLEAEMIAALKKSQTFKDRMSGQILRLVIIDPDWYIRRHELSGAILHRYIRAAVAIKGKDGVCRVWQLVTFQQNYVGNKFQATKFDGVGDPYEIDCKNVNK